MAGHLLLIEQPTFRLGDASIFSPPERRLGSMRNHRLWFEIVIHGTIVAFVLALLIATIGTVAGFAVEPKGLSHGQTYVAGDHPLGAEE
jgi:hypothetical protein